MFQNTVKYRKNQKSVHHKILKTLNQISLKLNEPDFNPEKKNSKKNLKRSKQLKSNTPNSFEKHDFSLENFILSHLNGIKKGPLLKKHKKIEK